MTTDKLSAIDARIQRLEQVRAAELEAINKRSLFLKKLRVSLVGGAIMQLVESNLIDNATLNAIRNEIARNPLKAKEIASLKSTVFDVGVSNTETTTTDKDECATTPDDDTKAA